MSGGGIFYEPSKHDATEQCFVCLRLGLEPAKLSEYATMTTLVGMPENEIGHDHDDNCFCTDFSCERGHYYTVRKRNTCPACDWKGKEECFCSPLGVRIYVPKSPEAEAKYKDWWKTGSPPPWEDVPVYAERVNKRPRKA